MPAHTGPTISFARGAPSLDIVDVEGLRDAAVRAFESDPGGHDRVRHVGRLPAPARLDRRPPRRRARARARHQRLDAGGRVPVRAPRAPRRRGDRRAPHLRPHAAVAARARGARCTRSSSSPTASTPTRSAGCSAARGRAAEARPHHPQLPEPRRLHAVAARSASALLELAATHGFLVFEDDPYVALRFSGEPLPTMLSMDPDRVVYASSFSKTVCPGIRVGYLVGPPELIDAVAQLATNTYISPNMVSQSIVYEFCASGAIERSIETVAHGARRARADARRRAAPRAARGRVRRARGRLLHVGDAARGTDVARAVRGRRRARGARS